MSRDASPSSNGANNFIERWAYSGSEARRRECELDPATVERVLYGGLEDYEYTAVVFVDDPYFERTTICKRTTDGRLMGQRDVNHGPTHDGILALWARDGEANGLTLEDLRRKP